MYEDDNDVCYECQGYGDDYSYDDEGNLISYCDYCPNNENNWEEGYWREDI